MRCVYRASMRLGDTRACYVVATVGVLRCVAGTVTIDPGSMTRKDQGMASSSSTCSP